MVDRLQQLRSGIHPSVHLITRARLSRDKNIRIVIIYIIPDTPRKRPRFKGEEAVRTRGLRKREFDKLYRLFTKEDVWPPFGYAIYRSSRTLFAFEIDAKAQVSAVQSIVQAALSAQGVYVSGNINAMTR